MNQFSNKYDLEERTVKLGEVIKEAQETKHWLRMIAKCAPEHNNELKKIWKECQELTLIFQKITA